MVKDKPEPPKKPLNAYMVFRNQRMRELKGEENRKETVKE